MKDEDEVLAASVRLAIREEIDTIREQCVSLEVFHIVVENLADRVTSVEQILSKLAWLVIGAVITAGLAVVVVHPDTIVDLVGALK